MRVKGSAAVNNHFLPAPVYAHSWLHSRCILVRLEIPARFVWTFHNVERYKNAAEGGDGVASSDGGGGENVGHKNVPVRNGPDGEESGRALAAERAFVDGFALHRPAERCVVGVHRLLLVYVTSRVYGASKCGLTVRPRLTSA